MHNGTEYQGRVHRAKSEIGVLLFDELPRGFFGKGFGGAVTVGWVFDSFGERDGVPVFFGICVVGPGSLRGIDNRGEGRGHHDAGYRGGELFDGVKDGGCTDYGGV